MTQSAKRFLHLFASQSPRNDRRRTVRHQTPACELLEDRCLLNGTLAANNLESAAQSQLFASQAELAEYLVDRAVLDWQSQFGRPIQNGYDYYPDTTTQRFAGTDDTASPAEGAAGDSPDFSGTNNQEIGVDESDIVKTDGRFLYNVVGRQLVIVDVQIPEEMQVVSRIDLPGNPLAQFLNGDRLTVVTQESTPSPYYEIDPLVDARLGLAFTDDIALWWNVQNRLSIVVYDVSDPTTPELQHESILDGSYVDSRMIGDSVYVVVRNDVFSPQPLIECEGEDCRYESEADYRARLMANVIEEMLPAIYRRSDNTDDPYEQIGSLTAAESIARPIIDDDRSLVTVVAFNTTATEPGPADSTSIFSPYTSTVYASVDNMFLLTPRWTPTVGNTTEIIQVSLAGDAVEFTSQGSVPGTVLNQFALDEEAGHLRVATTVRNEFGVSSAVFVLSLGGEELPIVGQVENIAPNEQIFAVRFIGERAYVVTFLRTDPLFVIDLADPANPTILGELEIPGFSRYLHPVGENYLIGIGRNADEETGRQLGLQASLFDVSEPSNPLQVGRYDITPPGWQFSSEAEFDHHAVGYYPDQGILAIPIAQQIHVGFTSPVFAPEPPQYFQSQLWVFQVDTTTGFEFLGSIEHDSQVRRSVRIEDVLFSIATDSVQAHPVADPNLGLGEVRLRGAQSPDLAPIDDKVIPPDEHQIDVELVADDPDGEEVMFSASINSLPYFLKESLGLFSNGKLFVNWGQRGEKWVEGNDDKWYFITPDGEFFEWDASPRATGTLIAKLDSQFHTQPEMLYGASPSAVPASLSIRNGMLSITSNQGYGGTFVVTVSATDGVNVDHQSFQVTESPSRALLLDRDLGFYSTGDLWENWGGLGERWFRGYGEVWYFITPAGALYEWDGSRRATGELIDELPARYHSQLTDLVNAADYADAFFADQNSLSDWLGR